MALPRFTKTTLASFVGCAILACFLTIVVGLYVAIVLAHGPAPTLHTPRAAMALEQAQSVHLALGVPLDDDPSDDTIVTKDAYALSFNLPRHGANWVAWKVDADDLGKVERYAGAFFLDPAVPPASQGTTHDYERSGFNRGHLCPSGDRTATAVAQESTFSLLNVLPQAKALNRGPWEALEKYTRRLAKEHRVFVAAGPIWGDRASTLGQHAIPIPSHFWKVVVVVCPGCGPEAVDPGTMVIAVMTPNEEDVGAKWMTYQTTMGEVEHRSGYHLLGRVPEATHGRLAAKLDMVGR